MKQLYSPQGLSPASVPSPRHLHREFPSLSTLNPTFLGRTLNPTSFGGQTSSSPSSTPATPPSLPPSLDHTSAPSLNLSSLSLSTLTLEFSGSSLFIL